MRQLKDVQILYAFILIPSRRTSTVLTTFLGIPERRNDELLPVGISRDEWVRNVCLCGETNDFYLGATLHGTLCPFQEASGNLF